VNIKFTEPSYEGCISISTGCVKSKFKLEVVKLVTTSSFL